MKRNTQTTRTTVKATKQLPAPTPEVAIVPVTKEIATTPAVVEMTKQVAQTQATAMYGENALAYEVGDLKCIGVKATQYLKVAVTNWKKWTNNVPEVGTVVRWGSGETWDAAAKTAGFKRAQEAHQRATAAAAAAATAKAPAA